MGTLAPSADLKNELKSHQGNCKGKRSRTRIKEITNETRYQQPAGHYCLLLHFVRRLVRPRLFRSVFTVPIFLRR